MITYQIQSNRVPLMMRDLQRRSAMRSPWIAVERAEWVIVALCMVGLIVKIAISIVGAGK